ncbi:hypothetical protein [Idiomarina xiamenensis]|uniref:Uncharacterized protein n=1 Tax=Idiomarina xiamenensis 10-D-4 TaxID=740709 RepID=K2KAA5_9GAMM|nr:hypothetical protein [Idiomarina xiamenensis]EKE84723.1 hypothetical protein A10D4_03895 [Idiomarina xiamenensis 10-D-4]
MSAKGPVFIQFRQWQQRMQPGPSANPLTRILMGIVFFFMLLVGLALMVVFVLVGWILLIPILWRRRKAMKQMYEFSRAAQKNAKQAQQQQQQQRQQRHDSRDSSVIEGEYEVKDER